MLNDAPIVEDMRTSRQGRYFEVILVHHQIRYLVDSGESGIEFVRSVLFDWDIPCNVIIRSTYFSTGLWFLNQERFEGWSTMSKVTGTDQ